MDQDIFKLVSREEERIKLFSDLAQAFGEVLCKGKAETLCKLRADSYNPKAHLLQCSLEEGSAKLENQESFLGYFFLGGEKYYFEGLATVASDKFYIALPAELFHLQRRQNYRVHIPDGYQAFFNIKSVNNKNQNITGTLGDLSSQGCRVLYKMNTPLMKVGDSIVGNLLISKNSPIEIAGTVKHIKVDESNKTLQTFGIEFKSLTPILENKLFALTMEIHKEVFRRPV
ncbi:MAG: flagellar brake protein [Bacillota bacterium]